VDKEAGCIADFVFDFISDVLQTFSRRATRFPIVLGLNATSFVLLAWDGLRGSTPPHSH